jgi:hypothetical protein
MGNGMKTNYGDVLKVYCQDGETDDIGIICGTILFMRRD